MKHNLSPGMVDGGDVTDVGPEHDLCSDTVEWRARTHADMLTVLSSLDGTGAAIHLDVKQPGQREGRCAAYACTEEAYRGVRGIGRGMKWCQDHHALVEILLIVRRGWAQNQDLMAELARYRREYEAHLKAEAERAAVPVPRDRSAEQEHRKQPKRTKSETNQAWLARQAKIKARRKAKGHDKLSLADLARVEGRMLLGPMVGRGDKEKMKAYRDAQKRYRQEQAERIAMGEVQIAPEDRPSDE